MSEHTPTPWAVAVDINHFYKGIVALLEMSGERFVAVVNPDDRLTREDEYLPNAEFIVRACNNHDDLLAACEAASAHYQIHQGSAPPMFCLDGCPEVFARIAAAIAKARGQ